MPANFRVILRAILVFAASALALLRLMPAPVDDTDYLIAGTVATALALLVLFFGLARKSGDVFFKKRKKQP
jgi:hypothetical protein